MKKNSKLSFYGFFALVMIVFFIATKASDHASEATTLCSDPDHDKRILEVEEAYDFGPVYEEDTLYDLDAESYGKKKETSSFNLMFSSEPQLKTELFFLKLLSENEPWVWANVCSLNTKEFCRCIALAKKINKFDEYKIRRILNRIPHKPRKAGSLRNLFLAKLKLIS